MLYESGRPFSTLHAITASVTCPPGERERRLPPIIDLYRKNPRCIHTQMELLPASRTAYAMFRRGPLAFAHHRESGAVNDQMHAFARRDSPQCDVEKLTAP